MKTGRVENIESEVVCLTFVTKLPYLTNDNAGVVNTRRHEQDYCGRKYILACTLVCSIGIGWSLCSKDVDVNRSTRVLSLCSTQAQAAAIIQTCTQGVLFHVRFADVVVLLPCVVGSINTMAMLDELRPRIHNSTTVCAHVQRTLPHRAHAASSLGHKGSTSLSKTTLFFFSSPPLTGYVPCVTWHH